MKAINMIPNFLIQSLLFFLLSSNLFATWSTIDGGYGSFETDPDFHLLYGGEGNKIYGDFNATGNSILSSNNPTNANLIYDVTEYKQVDANFSGTQYSLGDPEKMNSSSGTIHLPDYVQGSDIIWAGLFWQGHVYRKDGTYSTSDVDSNVSGWNKVTIKDSQGVMHEIEAPIGYNDLTHKAFHHTIMGDGTNEGFRHHYGAYHEITNIVRNSYSKDDNTFIVGNIKTTAGQDTSGFVYITQAPEYSGDYRFGLYGGWSMIVVYQVNGAVAVANSVPLKSVSIFDGFDLFLTWGSDYTVPFETTINVSGFYTPKDGDINSKLLFFGGAGDKGIPGDTLAIEDGTTGSFVNLSNAENPSGEQFNHSYTHFGQHMTPGDENKQGMDLDIFDVSSQMAHSQSSTNIKFGVVKSGGYCDQLFPQVIAISTEVYVPSFCYDYKYTQNDADITADFNTSVGPMISADGISTDAPVEVIFYIKNMVDSDLYAENMEVSIYDINTSQLRYIRDTTKRALNGQLYPVAQTDAAWGTTVSDSQVLEIPIGTQYNSDYFYVYYNLDPQTSSINDPLDINISYDLILDTGESIPYNLKIDALVPPCSDSSYNYTPAKGKFNIVHTETFNDTGFYTLPTQVTNREGSFSIISIDEDFSDGVDTLQDTNITVTLEMINVDGFKLTDAACTQIDNNISNPILLTMQDTSQMSFVSGNTSAYYGVARPNVAFRVSYDVNGENGGVVGTEQLANGNLKLTNFPDYGGESCNEQAEGNTVSQMCGSNGTGGGTGMDAEEFQACKECIFGKNTRFVCSRDNFAIRPEALMIKINDQNQTNSSVKVRIDDNVSGLTNPVTTTTNLAAGYRYSVEIFGVNHKDNNPSSGYTKTLNLDPSDGDNILFEWIEPTPVTCNYELDISTSRYFLNGYTEFNTTLPDVGFFKLSAIDKTWTAVDTNPLYRTHHDLDPYLDDANTPDCTQNSSITYAEGSTLSGSNIAMNGCDISSNHDSSFINAGTSLKYRDYNLSVHPYRFTTSITPTTGINNNTLTTGSFVYMSDINVSEDMAFHLNGNIVASGFDGTQLNNFTANCYAQNLDLSLANNINIALNPTHRYRYHNTNMSTLDMNGTINSVNNNIVLPSANFLDDQNGSLTQTLHFNYDRRVDTFANPRVVSYGDYNITCQTPANCRFYADLINNKETEAIVSIDQNLTYLYGRTNAPRKIFDGDTGSSFIYYESFCNGTDSYTVTCDKTLLPGTIKTFTNDPRWYVNPNHVSANDGMVGSISQKGASRVSVTSIIDGPPTTVVLEYDESAGSGYPYKATMENNASRWLIYNQFNNLDTTNEFEVEFVKSDSSWAGVDDANSTSKTDGASKTNRRIMW
jgi:hypothetical protein